MSELNIHPAAELFPLMQGEDFDQLVEDIRENGQRDPIVLTPDGQLLDGRNRYRAIKKLGDEPTTRVEHSEPWAYVISTNVHRRHLTVAQRSMIGDKIAERAHGVRGPDQTIKKDSTLVPSFKIADTLPAETPAPPAMGQVAELLGVSTGSIKRARQVREQGTPALQHAVEDGHVKVTRAAKIATTYTPEVQDELVELIRAGEATPQSARRKRTVDNGPVSSRSQRRHRYITKATLENLHATLDALSLVIRDATEGVDPSITPEEAQKWLYSLSGNKAAAGLIRLRRLLEKRKEEL